MTAAASPTTSSTRRRQSKPATAAKPRRRRPNHGKQLKERRKALGITQRELGVLLGTKEKPVPLSTISRWELGGTIEHPGMLFLALETLERRNAGDGDGQINATPRHDEPE